MSALVAFLLGLACLSALAQPTPDVVRPPTIAVAGHPGSTVYAALVLEVREGWAIQAHHPSLPYLIPTTLTFEPQPGLTIADVIYPEPTKKRMGFAGREIAVYMGTVALVVAITIEIDAEPGLREVRGTLVFQACTDAYCLLPEELDVLIRVWVLTNAGLSRAAPALGLFVPWDTFRTIQTACLEAHPI